MAHGISYQCVSCIHWKISWTRKAFSERIPDEIATGQHDHRKEYPGDNGVRWQFDPIYHEVIGNENGDE